MTAAAAASNPPSADPDAAAAADALPSAASAVDAPSSLVQLGMDALQSFHEMSGTPWWATIVLVGLLSRMAMVPLQLHSARLMASFTGMEPHFLQIDLLARQSPHTPWMRVLVVLKLKWALVSKYKCNPLYLVPGAAVQIGTFVWLAVSLRRLLRDPTSSLSTEGALWFPDLTATDPTFALPLIVWAAGYALSHVSATYYEGKSAKLRQAALANVIKPESLPNPAGRNQLKPDSSVAPPPSTLFNAATAHVRSFISQLGHFARGIQVLSIVFLPWFPSGVLLLWSSSIVWQSLWHAAIRRDDVRAKLGLTQREQIVYGRMALPMRPPQSAAQDIAGRSTRVQRSYTPFRDSASPTTTEPVLTGVRSRHAAAANSGASKVTPQRRVAVAQGAPTVAATAPPSSSPSAHLSSSKLAVRSATSQPTTSITTKPNATRR
jgi:membrane protein insertase Oxa1/YidC/SpoIIIJ